MIDKIKFIYFLATSIFVLFSCSSLNSDIDKDIKYFIQIRLVNENGHSSMYNGIAKEFKYNKLKFNNSIGVIESLYSFADFTPDVHNYNTTMNRYLNNIDIEEDKYNTNPFDMYNLNLSGDFMTIRTVLGDNFTAIVEVTKIKGTFLSFNKNFITLPSISYQIHPGKIKNVDNIILPIEFIEVR